MEPAKFASQIARLRSRGWTCRWRAEASPLPDSLRARYPWLPAEYLNFVTNLEECVNREQTSWLLTPNDFNPQIEKAFAHDAWERLSLEAADGDKELIATIRAFWDVHIPIHFYVTDGYAFHAIRLTDRRGQIVQGREPEFEEVEVVADSFGEFLARI